MIAASEYSYDAAGELVADGVGNSYQYNADGMVTASSGAQYVYDALDQRVEKTVGGTSTEYVYFQGSVLAEINAASGAWTDMIWGNGAMIAEVAGTQTATPEYRLLDHLGSLAVETNGSGTVTGSNVFLPFGQLVSSTTNDSFQFTGLEQDTENSSDHAWFRNLSTEQSRWLRPDPYNGSYDVTNPQSLNRYAYVLNNPLAFTDPSGLWVPPPPPSIICVQLGGDSWNVSTNAGGNWPGSTPSQNSCNGFGVGDGSGNGNGGAGAGGGSNGSTAPNNAPKQNAFQCGAAAAQGISPAAGLHNIPGLGSGVGGFVANAVGSNVFSAATDLITSFGSGSAGGHNVFYNMGQSIMAGPTQGFGAVFGNALEGTPFASGPVDAAAAAVFGEYATGVGEAKLLYDGVTYVGAVGGCLAGVIH